MQTILGAGGPVGNELAKVLVDYTDHIRLVSRNPQRINQQDELYPADLLNFHEMSKAIGASDIVYVTIGFQYNLKVWSLYWPKFIDNLIKAYKERKFKLVFFDNMYLYDKDFLGHMTESSQVNPPSEKGKIRANIVKQLEKNVEDLVIARSADFYGPSNANSMLTETLFKPLKKGGTANWLGSPNFKHSFTYVPDAAKATAILGNSPEAYGQVWHLPTAPDPMNGKEWVEKVAMILNTKPKYRVIPKWMLQGMGFFTPMLKESVEMLYQYEQDYVFDSSKIEKKFGLSPTAYDVGIIEVIDKL